MRGGEAGDRVSPRRLDARFLLPRLPRTVALLGGLDRWASALEPLGVGLAAADGPGSADAVFCPVARAGEAAQRTAADLVVVDGRAGVGDAVVALPDLTAPRAMLAPRHRHATAYAVRRWSVARSRAGRVRQVATATAARRGVLAPHLPTFEVRAASRATPAVVAACADAGVGAAEWFLATDDGPDAKRLAFFLFRPRTPRPHAVAKFRRTPGRDESATREETGLANAKAAPAVVADRAPRLLGCTDVAGHHVCVQSAVEGANLEQMLTSTASARVKRQLLDEVVTWLGDVAAATSAPASAAVAERGSVDARVAGSVTSEQLTVLDEVPAVFQHGDLAGGNVLVRASGFGLVDWEWATPHGQPLWDLLHLAVHALPLLDGGAADRAGLRRLFLGDAPSSPLLFDWVRRLAAVHLLDDRQVGALAELCWADHAARTAALRAASADGPREQLPVEIARDLWRAEPGLRDGWSARR